MIHSRRVGQVLSLSLLLATAGGAYMQAVAQTQNATPAKPPAAAQGKRPAPTKMVLEPRAMALLKAASDRLAAAKSMSFTAVASYEYPSQLGPPILYTVRYDVTMQRPDKLRVHHSRRRAGLRVLLRRQVDDGLRAGRESGRDRRCATDDRRCAEGCVRNRRHLLPVHRPARCRSLCRDDGRRDPRVLHRSVGHGGRHQDRDGGVGQSATCSCRSGSAPTTSCRDGCVRSTAPTR